MFAEHTRNQIIRETVPAKEALWKQLNPYEDQLCVVDGDDKFVGMLGRSDYPLFSDCPDGLLVGQLCNRKAAYVDDGPYAWHQARSIFMANRNIRLLAVVDEQRNIKDVFFRFQCFYDRFFNSQYGGTVSAFVGAPPVPGEQDRLSYAFCLWMAAQEAKNLGYKKISAVEFGVDKGNGLVSLEWHSRAMEKMFGVEIEVYGFDTGTGLPLLSEDYRDQHNRWRAGEYTMNDKAGLESRLTRAKLVMGDIRETGDIFFSEYKAAPIGVMLVDVDLYSSTAAILDLFKNGEDKFLPRVFMYFDDISWNDDFLGEAQAIKEFNAANNDMKISPEGFYGADISKNLRSSPVDINKGLWLNGIKTCHMFRHARYGQASKV